jgi:phosphatidylinositol alpha-1,6-mannosyltransferase
MVDHPDDVMSSHFEMSDQLAARRPPILSSMSKARRTRRGHIVVCALQTYSRIGGLQNFNKRVFGNLSDRATSAAEKTPIVLLRGDEGAAFPALPGVEVYGINSPFRYVWRAVLTAVTKADILLIAHINLLPIAVLVRCLRPRLPILLFVHGDDAWNVPEGRRKRWFEPLCLHAVTRIAAVSAYTAALMGREFKVPQSKYRILPNAVDAVTPSVNADQREPHTILTVTRLAATERRKHVDRMILAVALLRPKFPGLRYEIIGEGALRPELEALAKELKVDDIVKFLGRVDDATLDAAYARASVFALPSSKEGFGIVYLEAWQHGIPVLCSDQGAAKEIITDGINGFIVDHSDVAKIADRLERWLSDPGLAKTMGENGRNKVKDRYLNDSFRANLDRIIDDLLGEK